MWVYTPYCKEVMEMMTVAEALRVKDESVVTFRNAQEAFSDAIKAGRLSADENSPIYAGNFMYMGTRNGRDLFKDSLTREYLR